MVQSIKAKLHSLARWWDAGQGRLLIFLLKIRYWKIVRCLKPFAEHLEKEVFPWISGSGNQRVVVRSADQRGVELVFEGQGSQQSVPATAPLAEELHSMNRARIELATRLERDQIVDAFLLFLFSWPDVYRQGNIRRKSRWSKQTVAHAMRSEEGLHRFCACMRFDPDENLYRVKDSYCELFFSKTLNRYLLSQPRLTDHRALFRLAPRLALLALAVGSVPPLVAGFSATLGTVLWVAFCVATALGLWYAVFTLGSLQYDKEERDFQIREHLQAISSLAHFPRCNPHPVIKLDQNGKALYLNPAARRMMKSLGIPEGRLQELLPADYLKRVRDCLQKRCSDRETEVRRHDRAIQYLFAPHPGEDAVLVVGHDVTRLRQLEAELRRLNNDLEATVEARTAELAQTQDVTILCLASLAEIRDAETGRHLERTRLYVKVLAEKLRGHPRFREFLNDETIQHLFKSAPLHDIGKIGVPDAILLKPGKLTESEFEEIKRHTVHGGDALRWAEERLGFDSFLRVGRDIAYSHHERWDGRGYPQGLAGEEIPHAARIMALADVYDALTSRRRYKEPQVHARVRETILAEKGRHFDPAVVEAFVEAEEEFQAIAASYADEWEVSEISASAHPDSAGSEASPSGSCRVCLDAGTPGRFQLEVPGRGTGKAAQDGASRTNGQHLLSRESDRESIKALLETLELRELESLKDGFTFWLKVTTKELANRIIRGPGW